MAWPQRALTLIACAVTPLIYGACASAGFPASPSGASEIAVLGDSLAVSPRQDIAFPAVLQSRLSSASGAWLVKSFSVNGSTTADGLTRLNAALADHPAIMIVELGANDGLQGINIATIRANLQEIITRSKTAGAHILLCGMETTPVHGFGYFGDFRNVFQTIARDNDIAITPFILGGVIGDPDLTIDLVHPNAAGARHIADTIWPSLDDLVRQSTGL